MKFVVSQCANVASQIGRVTDPFVLLYQLVQLRFSWYSHISLSHYMSSEGLGSIDQHRIGQTGSNCEPSPALPLLNPSALGLDWFLDLLTSQQCPLLFIEIKLNRLGIFISFLIFFYFKSSSYSFRPNRSYLVRVVRWMFSRRRVRSEEEIGE